MSENCSSCHDDAPELPDGVAAIECRPFYVDGPTPSSEPALSRFDLARKLSRKGMIGLALGTAVGLVALPKAAEAVTCSCGPYLTAQPECEYAWYPAVGAYRRTGRYRYYYQRRYPVGTAGGCGSVCSYYSAWACDIYVCPPGMPGYC